LSNGHVPDRSGEHLKAEGYDVIRYELWLTGFYALGLLAVGFFIIASV
jgi:hypothetical protein